MTDAARANHVAGLAKHHRLDCVIIQSLLKGESHILHHRIPHRARLLIGDDAIERNDGDFVFGRAISKHDFLIGGILFFQHGDPAARAPTQPGGYGSQKKQIKKNTRTQSQNEKGRKATGFFGGHVASR
jgi:hypothetical protein